MDKPYQTTTPSSNRSVTSNHAGREQEPTTKNSRFRLGAAMDNSKQQNNDNQSMNSSSRLTSSKTFPVHLHHRNRSDARPTNDTTIQGGGGPTTERERQHWSRRLFIDTSDLDSDKSRGGDNNNNNNNGKHRYSKSRDHRIPRAVNQIASAGGARNLLPTRTFHRGGEKDRDGGDYNLLKPSLTHDSSRSPQSSRSTSAHNAESRKDSLAAAVGNSDPNKKLGWTNRREIKTMEDLDEVRRRREKGEESLRGKLSSMGSLAADITRRLDYTYYNLLERVSTLYSTIRTFQELIDSSSALQDNFQRDNANIEQDFRKQIGDFQNFGPQMRRIDLLEKRMSAGRNKMEALGNRLDVVRKEIEGWERRETEWQARVSRRLRIFWGVMGTAIVVLVVAYVVQIWRVTHDIAQPSSSAADLLSQVGMLSHQPRNAMDISQSSHKTSDYFHETPAFTELGDVELESFLRSPPLSTKMTTTSASENSETSVRGSDRPQGEQSMSNNDPLRLFDEL